VRDINTAYVCISLESAGWIIVILSVVSVFLVPSGFGPYSAVNGPTTVFKSLQHADAVRAIVSDSVLLGIRPLVSLFHSLRIAASSPAISRWIGILEKYCVRLC
jgi:hypothetical protein